MLILINADVMPMKLDGEVTYLVSIPSKYCWEPLVCHITKRK